MSKSFPSTVFIRFGWSERKKKLKKYKNEGRQRKQLICTLDSSSVQSTGDHLLIHYLKMIWNSFSNCKAVAADDDDDDNIQLVLVALSLSLSLLQWVCMFACIFMWCSISVSISNSPALFGGFIIEIRFGAVRLAPMSDLTIVQQST